MPARRSSTRTRRSADATVDELASLVNGLIRENASLRRQLARLSTAPAADSIARGLNALNRRVQRALGAGASSTRGRSATTPKRRRRQSTDPAVHERRLAALAKAR